MVQTVIGEATIFGVAGVGIVERSIVNGSEFHLVLSKEIVGAVYTYNGNLNAIVDFASGSIGTSWSVVESDGIEQYEIVAIEDIQVPAGTFQGCYKVANSKINPADGSVISYDERWWPGDRIREVRPSHWPLRPGTNGFNRVQTGSINYLGVSIR